MAAIDDFASYCSGLDTPAVHATAVTPSDTNDLAHVTRYVYVGGVGDVSVNTLGGESATVFKAVPVGTLLKVRATRVLATGTTATNLVAMW